ncbi:MAG: hypothetical protein K9I68_07565 [Bacteroidales bacterium]|nr:hypothetical protein [Bacteroidales bacterium]MCF8338357.1 hypothetical protein [Bacteroidales bacterium]
MIIKVLIALLILAAVVLLPVGLALLLKQEGGEISFGSSCAIDDKGESGEEKACAACEIKDLVNCDYNETSLDRNSGSVQTSS